MRSIPSLQACLALTITLLIAQPHKASASWPADPNVNLPICTAAGTQAQVQSASDGAGGAILAWIDARPGQPGIYVQRVSSTGVPLWAPGGMLLYWRPLGSVSTPRNERLSGNVAIVPDGAGGAVVAWNDSVGPGNTDILAQRIDGSGSPLWDPAGVAVCRAAGRQFYPVVVMDGTTGAIVAWQDWRTGVGRIYAQHVDASGSCTWAPDGVLASSTSEVSPVNIDDGTLSLVMATDDLGGAILAWHSTAGIVGQRLGPDGGKLWPVNDNAICKEVRTEIDPAIVPDGSHGAFVAWTSYRNAAVIYAQHVNAEGTVLLGSAGMQIDGSPDAWWTQAASDGHGGCIIVWGSSSPFYCWPCNGSLIKAQRLNSAGAQLWAWGGVVISDATRGVSQLFHREYQAIVPDGAGGAYVSWMLSLGESNGGPYDIYAQQISASGLRLWSGDIAVSTAAANQNFPVIVAGSNGAIVAWEDWRNGNSDIFAQKVSTCGLLGDVPPDQPVAFCRVPEGHNRTADLVSTEFFGVCNCGCVSDRFVCRVTDTQGWIVGGDRAFTVTLGPGSCSDAKQLQVLPSGCGTGEGDSITLSAFPASDPTAIRSRTWVDHCFDITPVQVGGLEARPEAGSVELTWSAFLDGPASFQIQRSVQSELGYLPVSAEIASGDKNGYSYVDRTARPSSEYFYRVAYQYQGSWQYSTPVHVTTPRGVLAIMAVAPNPSASGTRIDFQLDVSGPVLLGVYDFSGRRVRTLVSSPREAGLGSSFWDGRSDDGQRLAAGGYFVRLVSIGRARSARVTLIR